MQWLLWSIMSWGQFYRMRCLSMGMDDESLRLLFGSTWLLLGPAPNMLSLRKYIRLIWLAVYYLQFWDALYAPRSSNSSIFRFTLVKTAKIYRLNVDGLNVVDWAVQVWSTIRLAGPFTWMRMAVQFGSRPSTFMDLTLQTPILAQNIL